MGKVVCPWNLIIDFVTDAFVGYGVPREDAEICTDVLLESDKRGIESSRRLYQQHRRRKLRNRNGVLVSAYHSRDFERGVIKQ